MTEKEIVEKLLAGETVTLYHPMKSYLGVGKRTLKLLENPGKYHVYYDDNYDFTMTFDLKNNLLKTIIKDKEAEPNFWLAWGRALRLQKARDQGT